MTTRSQPLRDRVVQELGAPNNCGEPVFSEPWEAQAFALTLHLHEQGHFSWEEWADTLSNKIKEAQQGGDPDDGSTYYQHWLAALEALVVKYRLSDIPELTERRDRWDRAVRNTPHGKPIELENADLVHHHHDASSS